MANSWFPFQDVPGLLTPEMSNNVRTRSLLSASAGLLGSAGWSDKPVNMWQAIGAGLQGGLQGYESGTNDVMKQMLLREQVEKLQEARRQNALWSKIFGGPGTDTTAPQTASPAPALPTPSLQAPAGLLTPSGPVPAPAPAGTRPEVPSSPTVWGDKEGEAAGLYDTPGKPAVMPTGPVVPPAKVVANNFPTQRDVQTSTAGGLSKIVADMPAGVRQMIAIAGPEKGKEILAQWVGKKAEKPSDTFLTVELNGQLRPFRADSPELDAAIKAGGLVVTTPSARGQNDLVTVKMPDGAIKSFRKDDPAIDRALGSGAIEVGKPSADPKDAKPDNYVLPDGSTVLSSDGKNYVDASGKSVKMPFNAIKLGSDTAFEASRQAKVQGRAQKTLDESTAPAERPPAESPTGIGTGIKSNVTSTLNAVTGGAVDGLFGKQPFADNEANRNYLLNLRQVAKTALVNNPRFPIAEQANVDRMFPDPEKFWANPGTEKAKIPLLRNTLEQQLHMNNEAIAGGALSKEEIGRLTTNNLEVKRALQMLGHGDSSLKVLGGPAAPASKPAPAAAETPPTPNARKAPDGHWYEPDPTRPGNKYRRVITEQGGQ